jgi:hypothetical protein
VTVGFHLTCYLTVLLSTQTCIQILLKVFYSWQLTMFGDGLTLCEQLL